MAEHVRGTFEIHIFVSPINPPADVAQKFSQTCQAASTKSSPMKGLFLYLDFENVGFAGVLQSSRYCTGSLEDAKRVCKQDSDMLREAGFEVIRDKIEAIASNEGVPDTAADAPKMGPKCYFEFHIGIRPADPSLENFPEEDMIRLRAISSHLTKELEVKVPLSYNAFKPSQRFLNSRTYNLGRKESYAKVERICKEIEATGTCKVEKVIREYIVYDTNVELDKGWLE